MIPPERFKRRVFPHWEPPTDKWLSVTHHEAGHVVAAEHYGMTPHSAYVDLRKCCGAMLLPRQGVVPPVYDPDNNPVYDPIHDEESNALGIFSNIGLNDASNTFEENALRAAVILMAGQQAELMQAGIVPAGVLRMMSSDTRQATYLLRLIFGTDVALGWAQLQARYLLRQYWARVEEVASELREKGYWHHANKTHC